MCRLVAAGDAGALEAIRAADSALVARALTSSSESSKWRAGHDGAGSPAWSSPASILPILLVVVGGVYCYRADLLPFKPLPRAGRTTGSRDPSPPERSASSGSAEAPREGGQPGGDPKEGSPPSPARATITGPLSRAAAASRRVLRGLQDAGKGVTPVASRTANHEEGDPAAARSSGAGPAAEGTEGAAAPCLDSGSRVRRPQDGYGSVEGVEGRAPHKEKRRLLWLGRTQASSPGASP